MFLQQNQIASLTFVLPYGIGGHVTLGASYAIYKAGGVSTAGTGSFSPVANYGETQVCKVILGAGDTDTLGDLCVAILDGSSNVIAGRNYQVVQWDVTDAAMPADVQYWVGHLATTDGSNKPVIGTVDALDAAAVDAILDRSNGVETGLTLRQALRLLTAESNGKLLVSGGTFTFRDVNDSKNRIVVTADTTGRTSVTRDVS